jgi:predicted kinase
MEGIIFIGAPASGKSTFFKENFADTHVRINLDMLKKRDKEQLLFMACLKGRQRFVIDNTNPTIEDRERYLQYAKEYRCAFHAYYFNVPKDICLARNRLRKKKARVPDKAIEIIYAKLEPPSTGEGFSKIYNIFHEE